MNANSIITELSRRDFLRATAAGAAAPMIVSAAALGRDGAAPANERIQVGLIGCGGMGRGNLKNCAEQPDVAITAICDVWKPRRDFLMERFKDSARPYHDYRELLARDDVDAVIIATPPHWHCRMAVDACAAGKDLYLQKPMTLHLAESLAVRNAVKKHNRICQIGTQIHATENYRRAVEWVRSGKLGKIGRAHAFNVGNQGPDGIGNPPDCDPPKDLDWDFWVGPYPTRPFNPLIVERAGTGSSFMEYSGGNMTNMGPHVLDLAVWALDLGYPEKIFSTGGRFAVRDAGDSPDVQQSVWQYPDLTLSWHGSLCNALGCYFGPGAAARTLGVNFYGLRGSLLCDYTHCDVVSEGDQLKDVPPPDKGLPPSPGHEREWLDSIISRKQPSCCAEYHHRVNVPAVLANLSLRLGRSIRFDGQQQRIVGDAEAARLARPEYRHPWKFPEEYIDSSLLCGG